MARVDKEGDFAVTASSIIDLLAEPLPPEWTVEGLAERLLDAFAAQPDNEIVLDAAQITNRQAARLIRPVLACVANMSRVESATSGDVFRSAFSFKRTGPEGDVWIVGQIRNLQGGVGITLRKSSQPPLDFGPQETSATTVRSLV